MDGQPEPRTPPASRHILRRIVFVSMLAMLLTIGFSIRRVAPETVPLTMDSLDTLRDARALARGESIPLENEGAFAGMATSPVAEWLYAIPLRIRDSLDSAILFTVVCNLVAAGMLAGLCTPLLGRSGGVTAVALLVCNLHQAAWFSRQPINSNLAAPFAILYLFFLLRLGRTPTRGRLLVTALILGILLQLHPASWSLLLLLPLQRHLSGAGLSRREAVPLLGGLLLPVLPLLIAEIIQGFPTLLAFGQHLVHPPPGGDGIPRHPGVILRELVALFSGHRPEIVILLGLGCGVLIHDLGNPERRSAALILLGGLFIPVGYLSAVSGWLGGRFFPHYLATVLPFAALVCGRGICRLWSLTRTLSAAHRRPVVFLLPAMALLLLAHGLIQNSRAIPLFLRSLPASLNNRGGLERLARSLDPVLQRTSGGASLRFQFLSNRDVFLSPGGLSFLLPGEAGEAGNAGISLLRRDRSPEPAQRPWLTAGILLHTAAGRLAGLPDVRIHEDFTDPEYLLFSTPHPLPVGFLQPGEVLTGPVPYQP